MVMTHTHAKGQGQRSLSLKVKSGNRRMDVTALPSMLTRLVNMADVMHVNFHGQYSVNDTHIYLQVIF